MVGIFHRRLLHGGVDRNQNRVPVGFTKGRVASFAGAWIET
ncbi:hypothetical protein SAMN05421512_108113 [Stappia indica]|uniref:Uncharacterized protein n=1 Tax=Stappia indica TaxID=538381 RepID=A0A285T7D4_9HYPH|nr:hypothetical protein SAMN05421512_108113 [Stappia indica]